MDKLVISPEQWAFTAIQPLWIILNNPQMDNKELLELLIGAPFPFQHVPISPSITSPTTAQLVPCEHHGMGELMPE